MRCATQLFGWYFFNRRTPEVWWLDESGKHWFTALIKCIFAKELEYSQYMLPIPLIHETKRGTLVFAFGCYRFALPARLTRATSVKIASALKLIPLYFFGTNSVVLRVPGITTTSRLLGFRNRSAAIFGDFSSFQVSRVHPVQCLWPSKAYGSLNAKGSFRVSQRS